MRKFIFAICLVILLGIKFSPETVIAASDGIACEVSQHSVNIDWADALGEHNYKDVVVILSDKTSKEIERYNIEDGETSYTISNLDGGTRYMIEIKGTRVYDDETNGEWENWGIANFDILTDPVKVTGLKQVKWWIWAEKCDVKWSGQDTDYDVIVKTLDGKTVAEETGYSNNTMFDFSIKNNNIYTVQVRATITSDSSSYIDFYNANKKSEWSDKLYCLTQPLIKGVSYNKSGAMELSFNKIKGASDYTVYMSTKEKKGYKKVKTLKGNFVTISKLGKQKISKSKKYYVYIVTRMKKNGHTYTSGRNYTTTVHNQMLQTNLTF